MIGKSGQALSGQVVRDLVWHRPNILTESLLVFLNLGIAIAMVADRISGQWIADRTLAWTLAFILVQTAAIFLLLAGLFGLKWRGQFRARRTAALMPELREIVARISGGTESGAALVQLFREAPQAVELCIGEVLAAQTGAGRMRVIDAAAECGLVAQWKRLAASPSTDVRCQAIIHLGALPGEMATEELHDALDDPEELIAVEAARAILRSAVPADIERIFDALPEQTVLVQALVLAAMRKHAGVLATTAIPCALQSNDKKRVAMGLNAVITWGRTLPLEALRPLLSDADSNIRALAFRALPWTMLAEPPLAEMRTALKDEDDGVLAAAAAAAGRLARTEMVPLLAALLPGKEGSAGREAALALSVLGRDGVAALETAAVSGMHPLAETAAEALERHRIGRAYI